jgi:peptidoglycan/LPS O-acetylase OafA/YrhL
LVRFYVRRFRRIVPAYVVVLLATTLASAVLLTAHDFSHFWASLHSAARFSSNHYFAEFGEYFAPQSTELPLLHLWSISVEVQFYLAFPLLILLLPKRHMGFALAGVLVIAVSYFVLTSDDGLRAKSDYFSLSGRIPEFLIGSTLAATRLGGAWSHRVAQWAAWVGTFAVSISLMLFDEATVSLARLSLIPCVGVALIIAARDSTVNRVLTAAPLVWVGGISYSLYLWHWPILALIRYYTEAYTLTTSTAAATVAITFAFSYLSFRFVEVPFRKSGPDGRSAAALLALVGSSAALLTAGPRLNASIGPNYSDAQLRYAPPDEICHGKIIGDCLRGSHSAEEEWLLVGDSHAAQLSLFFDVVGRANNFKVRTITGSSCVTIPGFDVHRIPEDSRRACSEQIQMALPHIEKASVITIAGMWQYHASSEEFWTSFESFLDSAAARHQSVIVFAQIPMLDGDPLRARRFAYLGITPFPSRKTGWANANCRMQKLVARYPSAQFFDLSASPIFSHAPAYEGSLIYFDGSHLNEFGATLYGEAAKGMLAPGAIRIPASDACGAELRR